MRARELKITETELGGALVIEPRLCEDSRGWFSETYSKPAWEAAGLFFDFLQDNHSFSAQKGTLRGLHFQKEPKAQTKLVRCLRGKIFNVIVDLRKGSPTYKKWTGIELSAQNKRQLLVPKGFANGFVTLEDDTEVQYKVDEPYSPQEEGRIRYDDPEIGIDWGISYPFLSDKDRKAPFLRESGAQFSLRVLVTGARGQLGSAVASLFRSEGLHVTGIDKEDGDIRDQAPIYDIIRKESPHLIVHCAAFTDVDLAEEEQSRCYDINVRGTEHLVKAAEKFRLPLVYISTDYVFNGEGETPWKEDDSPDPVNFYGMTKARGEEIVRGLEKHFIVRTSWLYGRGEHNFVKTLLRLGEKKKEVMVVSDQIGAPTYTVDLARLIYTLIGTTDYGTYHGVSGGFCSRCEFARAIFQRAGLDVTVTPVLTSEIQALAQRPLNSRLSQKRIEEKGLLPLPHWKDALERFFADFI